MSTLPSIVPNTSMPDRQVGFTDILAFVESSGCVDETHGTESDRVRHHRVQRSCRNRNDEPSAHQGRGSVDGLGIGLFGVNLDQVGSHYYRGPSASATSMAIWYLPKGALNCT